MAELGGQQHYQPVISARVLAYLVPSDRRLGWANRQVLADLVPSGRRFGWANRQVLADLVPSGRRLGWAIGKCLPIWFLRVVALDGQIRKCFPFWRHLHYVQFFTKTHSVLLDNLSLMHTVQDFSEKNHHQTCMNSFVFRPCYSFLLFLQIAKVPLIQRLGLRFQFLV